MYVVFTFEFDIQVIIKKTYMNKYGLRKYIKPQNPKRLRKKDIAKLRL